MKEIKEWFTDYQNYQIKTLSGKKYIITNIPSGTTSSDILFFLMSLNSLKDEERI